MRRLYMIIVLMAICSMAVYGQDKVTILAKSISFMMPVPTETDLDEETGKRAVRWHNWGHSWNNGFKWLDKVDKVDNITEIFPNLKNLINDMRYCPIEWMLSEENNETVLHCYLRMPEDEVDHLWIANEEVFILDKDTGTRYQARRTSPADMWDRHFGIRAKKGDWIDLKVIFPELPESVKNISISGIRNWNLTDEDISAPIVLDRGGMGGKKTYDEAPKFRTPRLVKAERNYNKDDNSTWAVYENVQLVKPARDSEMAIWLTKDATYIGLICKQKQNAQDWNFSKYIKLIDDQGKIYHLLENVGLTLGHHFLVKGSTGDYVAFLLKFEPIPLGTTNIAYIEPPTGSFDTWGANSDGRSDSNLSVNQLRKNQDLFKYNERVIVK